MRERPGRAEGHRSVGGIRARSTTRPRSRAPGFAPSWTTSGRGRPDPTQTSRTGVPLRSWSARGRCPSFARSSSKGTTSVRTPTIGATARNSETVPPREVRDRAQDRSPHRRRYGNAGMSPHVDLGADDAAARADGSEGERHQVADRRETDRRVGSSGGVCVGPPPTRIELAAPSAALARSANAKTRRPCIRATWATRRAELPNP